MNNIRLFGKKKLRLPYEVVFSGLRDGNMPKWFKGASWTVSGGKGICSPSLGAELLTDGGLEAAYVGGLCGSLSVGATTPTVAESDDEHLGSKAQSFVADANNEVVAFPNVTPTANTWYKFTGWGKRTAGTNNKVFMRLFQSSGKPTANSDPPAFTDAAYGQRKIVKWTNSASVLTPYAAYQSGAGGYDTVLVDDFSLKIITAATMFALLNSRLNIVIAVKAKYTWDRNGVAGVVARANAASNPSTFLIAYYWNKDNAYAYCVLDKCVNGTYTNLIATWTNTPGAGGGGIPTAAQWLEIRCNGDTVQLFHNNIQVGTDQTVTGMTGTFAGVFQSGGSQLESFFVEAS